MAAYPPPTRKTRTRWVGRSTILPGWPAAPQWVRFLALTLCFVGVQLLWSCEMAQGTPPAARALLTRQPRRTCSVWGSASPP